MTLRRGVAALFCLAATAGAQAPRFIGVDTAAEAVLQKQISGRLNAGSAAEALRAIGKAANISLVYESQTLAAVRFRGSARDSVTVGEALVAVLDGASVDVIARSPTSYVVVPRADLPPRVSAQPLAFNVAGIIRDSTTRRPIAGAVVIALDSARAILARTLTSQAGRFRVAGPARVATLRVQKIGYRMRELSPGAAGAIENVDLALARIPWSLQPVVTRMNASCPVRSDNAVAMALVDQARAGLLATLVTDEAEGARYDVLGYKRRYARNSTRIMWQSVRYDSASHRATSFKAAHTADQFVRTGFMEVTTEGQKFLGPDAEILLDSRFSDTYCFRIASPEKGRPNQLGLHFSPVRIGKDRVDIDGTLWIDTTARELRDIEYDYVGLGHFPPHVRPRGLTRFRAMPNGVVTVDLWWIRLPAVQEDSVFDVKKKSVIQHFYLTEIGGHLATAEWPDGTIYKASLGSLEISALVPRDSLPLAAIRNRDSSNFVPGSGIAFRLQNTDYRGVTDESGHAVIPDLIPGPYVLELDDPTLNAMGAQSPRLLEFTVGDASALRRVIHTPGAADVILAGCRRQGEDPLPSTRAYLMGRAVDAQDNPLENVEIEYRWDAAATPFRTLNTGPTGLFYLCMGPEWVGRRLTVSAQLKEPHKEKRTLVIKPGIATMELVVR
jgi:hypothetical protein